MKHETGRRIRLAGVILFLLYCTIVMKRELSKKEKLSIYQSIFVSALTFGHEGWVMTVKTGLWIQVDTNGFSQEGGCHLP